MSVVSGLVLSAALWIPSATPAYASSPQTSACSTAGTTTCAKVESPAARIAWAARMAAASAGHTPSAACGPVRPGYARCFALQIATSATPPNTCGSDASYIPCDLQTAYDLPSVTNGRGHTVAIVDAYDDPSAEADLAVYRSNFGLPACTTANGCFRKVNQTGGTSYPAGPPANDNWPLEISLDLDMVSAICPNCHILLVEAHADNDDSLFIAEDEAAKLGATEISNSWGGDDGVGEAGLDPYFDHPGIPITASTGDDGYAAGVEYPAASPDVTAVGGTTLVPAGNPRGFNETAWVGAGSGCSLGETPQPSWQHGAGVDPSCNARADADVSAIADPNDGVYTYDTDNGVHGWVNVGGTSVASPIIASVYALTSSATTRSPSYLYSHTSGLNDVTSGSNGSCGGSNLCNAGAGWDGPTGLGTPNGISAFGIGPPAVITSVTPATGPIAGGQTVTVNGSGFQSGMTATIGGTAVTPASVTFNSFTITTPAEAAGYVQIQATTSVGASALTAADGYIYVGLANYTPLAPFRILDTRSGHGDPLGPGATRTLQITGVGSPLIPAAAGAVVLNVTEVDGSAASLLTVYPAGTLRPNASNLNFAAGTVTANLVTATLGQGGAVNIYNALGSVNVLADVEGYFKPPASSTPVGEFHPTAPVRVCDTRSARTPTPCSVHGALVGGTPMVVNVTGSASGSIPNDGTAEAAVLNITGVAGTLPTYISVFPTTASGTCAYNRSNPPRISTLNLEAGAVVANRVMVALGPATSGGPDTSVCVFAAVGRINIILDAGGWYGKAGAAAGAQYEAISPSRICDTRVASAGCSTGAIGASVSRIIGVAGNGGVPDIGGGNPVIVAIIANLTAIAPTSATYLTVYPSGATVQKPPLASDLNVNAGETLPNLAVVQLDTSADAHDGDVSLYNSVGSVNAAIDLEGWFQ
jgi:hypothetical protein